MAQVIAAWRTASELLDIEVTAPFTLRAGVKPVHCVAFLPHFGSPRGVVVGAAEPPGFDTDPELVKQAEKAGFFYSFINTEIFTDYDERRFKETLKDWGFFGPMARRPHWLGL